MPTIEESFAHCERMARTHYENFPVGSRFIPKGKRKYVWAVYAFARTADDFADEGRRPQESPEDLKRRLDQLDGWEARLARAVRGQADDLVFPAVARTLEDLDIPVQLLKDLLEAYRMDVRQKRYPAFEQVYFYCRHSANPVGRLVLHIFGYKDESLFRLSDHICTALQLTNFWQDVAVDLAKDRIYLPQKEMQRFGVTEGDLQAGICNRAFQNLMQDCWERTAALFNEGLPLCSRVGRDLRMEMRLTWLGGTTILNKIRSVNYDVFRRRPALEWADKAKLAARACAPWRLSMIH